MNKQLETEIKTQVLTVLDINGNVLIQHVGKWNDQVQNLRAPEKDVTEYAYNLPAVFLEFKDKVKNPIGNNVLIYDPLDICLHIVHDQLDAGGEDMENNTDILAIKEALNFAFQLFRPTNTSNLTCIEEEEDYNHDNIYHYTLTYRCTFTDYSTQLPMDGSAAPLPSGGLPYKLDNDVNFT